MGHLEMPYTSRDAAFGPTDASDVSSMFCPGGGGAM